MPNKFGGETFGWCPSFTGDHTDWVGSNDGTASGGVTIELDRLKGGKYAGVFDGTGYIDLTTELDLTGDFTISFWKKGNVSNKLIGSAVSAESIEQTSTTVIRSGFGTAADFTVPTNDADWHHVCLTRIGTSLRLYYDSTESSTGAITNSDTVHVGRLGGDSSGADFTGSLSDVRVHPTRGFVASEVKELSQRRAYDRRLSLGSPVGVWSPSLGKHDVVDGTVIHDRSGNGNVGTITGSTYVNDSEKGGRKALSFNGSSNYVNIGPMPFGTGDFTVSINVKPGTTSSGIVIGNDSAASRQWTLWVNQNGSGASAGYVTFFQNANSQVGVVSTSSVLTVDEWTSVTVTRISGTYRLYIDGVLNSTNSPPAASLSGTEDIFLGKRGYVGFEEYFSGSVDAVVFYDYALTDDEILYLSGSRTQQFPEDDPDLIFHASPTNDPGSVANGGGTALNLADLGGSTNGTLQGTAAFDTTDRDLSGEAAFDLDGTSGCYVETGLTPASLVTDQTFTFSLWANPASYSGDRTLVTSDGKIFFRLNSANLQLIVIGLTPDRITVAHGLSSGWHHFAGSFDGTQLELFVDGSSIGTVSVSGTWTTSATPFRIGSRNAGTLELLNGLIDEVRIYNRALFPQEIADIHERQRPGKPVSYNQQFGTGYHAEDIALEGHWLLEDTSGVDRSSHGRDGTVNGSPTTGVGPTGWLTNAIDFDGVDDYVLITDYPQSPSFLALCRVYLDVIQNHIFGFYNATTFSGWGARISSFVLQFWDGVSWKNCSSTLSASSWHDLAFKVDGTTLTAFVDGVAQTPVTISEIPTQTQSSSIAATSAGAGLLNGRVSDVILVSDVANEKTIENWIAGPNLIVAEAEPSITGTPTEGTDVIVNTGIWDLCPTFDGGSNGTQAFRCTFYVADDTAGTNETIVAIEDYPASYTPTSGDVGKSLRVKVEGYTTNSGIDTLETWYTDYATVAASGGVSETTSETITLSDSTTATLSLPEGNTDIFTFGDSALASLRQPVLVEDSLSLTSTASAPAGAPVEDTFILTDTVQSQITE